jgi:hypothetical protein
VLRAAELTLSNAALRQSEANLVRRHRQGNLQPPFLFAVEAQIPYARSAVAKRSLLRTGGGPASASHFR